MNIRCSITYSMSPYRNTLWATREQKQKRVSDHLGILALARRVAQQLCLEHLLRAPKAFRLERLRAPRGVGGQASGGHELGAGLAAGPWVAQRGTAVNWSRPCRPDGEHSSSVPPVGRSSARTARASTATQPEE